MGALRFTAIAPILVILYSLGFTNLFLRSNFGVMTPDLARELALEPAALSTVASAYFFAYAAMQVPTGILLDRFGSRRTIAALLLFTAIGTALFAVGTSASTLTLARLLMGFGCAGIFTGAFYVLAHWLESDRVVTQVGALNSFSSLGALCATTPFAMLIAAIGWRESYWLFTAFVALLTLAVAALLRDAPPDRTPPPVRPQGFVTAVAGVLEALRQPGMRRLLVAGLPMSSAGTIAGVWGAPYLQDVHALDDIGRGNVLLAMAASAIVGHFLHGQIARRLNTLKGMILAGSCVIFLATAMLALIERPPLTLVVVLFCLIGLSGAFPAVAHAHTRGLVAPHLVGRGISLTNMGIMAAVAFMQLVFGWIIGAFAHGSAAPPEQAYRAGFAALAAAALLAIAIYAPVRDVRPRG
ncbi:MAG TPA: MFS transporter [Hyphomicrobiaceae bacterium]|nr:MFS transporter [Hyphomicrobiaceae bacterium]